MFYQVRNVMELMEAIARAKPEDQELDVELRTIEDDFKQEDQRSYLDQVRTASQVLGIRFSWSFDDSRSIHARHIVTDHGWKILLDRGLDIFQRYEMNDAFAVSNRLQQYRACKASEATFMRYEAEDTEVAVPDAPSSDIADLIEGGESDRVEFKGTLRYNAHSGKNDPDLEDACLKSICAFLNSRGGTLLVGVADDGTVLGTEHDGFKNEDKMELHLVNLIRSRIGADHFGSIVLRFETVGTQRVFVAECEASDSPVYMKDNKGTEHFYIRTGASTTSLSQSETVAYIKKRFG
jgi:ATP-dependent Lon protease